MEIQTLLLGASDAAGIKHELEHEVIQHLICSTGKPWPYQGLNQDGMRFIRELGIAAAKARGGRLYESLNNRDWGKISDSMDVYIVHAETAPTLYACRLSVSQEWLARKLEGFHDSTDVAVEFWKHGRNFDPVDAVHRVARFVEGTDEIVTDQTRDAMLNVVAQHQSCIRAFSRLACWLLIGVILSCFAVFSIERIITLVRMLAIGWPR